MHRARDTGLPIATEKTRLSTSTAQAPVEGFAVYLPIYAAEETPVDWEERMSTLRGFVVATYLPESLWAGITGSGEESLLDLEIYEGDTLDGRALLFDKHPAHHSVQKSRYSESLQMSFFGHRWTLYFSTLPAFEIDSKRSLTRLALGSGAVISFLLFGIAWSQANARAASERMSADLQRSEDSLRHANGQLQVKVLESDRAQQELAQAHRRTQTEQQQLAVTLRSIGDAVVTTDVTGRVVLLNQAAEALTGWRAAEAAGRSLTEVLQLRHRSSVQLLDNVLPEVLRTGELVTSPQETALVSRSGRTRSVSVTAAPIRGSAEAIVGAVLVARDTTEQQRLETELLTARKLESLGVLASGLAHEFNTLLTGILGNVSVARMFAAEVSDIDERLSHAEKSCLRAKELTERLLSFSRSDPPLSRVTPIIDLLNDTANLALKGSKCRCEFVHPEDLWPVQIDAAQICQVIYDLVTNATQSMPDGGIIQLATRNVTLSSQRTLPLSVGNYVQISVRDHGAGIAPEHLPRIFDPYFTTKQQGSGLGLAAAYFILQRHHGIIFAESQPRQGTTFRLYLPAAPEPLPTEVEPLPLLPGIQGRILLMDDDPLILNLGAVVLRRLGYEVVLAKHGEEALERFTEQRALGHGFAAVILDLTIQGGMGGEETLKRLAVLDPKLKAIATSGYVNDPVMLDCAQYGFAAALTKPLHGAKLVKTLSALSSSKDSSSKTWPVRTPDPRTQTMPSDRQTES
jgi:PAS domain S-box-containing protein